MNGSTMNIAFFETGATDRQYLERALQGHKLRFFEEPLSLENVDQATDCDAVSVFIYSRVDSEVLAKLPAVTLITTRSTGFDHIDLAVCAARNITVSNVPYYGENTVAEHTFALILALSRNVHKSYVRTLHNDFSVEGLKGFDLKDKTLGVIGTGHIGLHVIRIAKGFGMHVMAHDVREDTFISEVLHYRYTELDELLAQSDIVTLHMPYMPQTHHFINRETIAKMKRGALLINTSRGGLVDTDALLEAIDEGVIAGVGIDVLEGEDLIKEEKQILHDAKNVAKLERLYKDHLLLSQDNVVFTPHIAFYSQEALERILNTTVTNITEFFGGNPENVVR